MENYGKNQKDKTRSAKKTRFWVWESVTHGKGISTPQCPSKDDIFN